MSDDRKERATDAKLDARQFDDTDVRKVLDEVSYTGMVAKYGLPVVSTHMTSADGWSNGDGRPALADDDPAIMQAIGRCAAARVRWDDAPPLMTKGVHPAPCGWCEWPIEELLVACSWDVWKSGHIGSETMTWEGANGSHYTRGGRHDVFTSPTHAEFWATPRDAREARVQAAIAASRGVPA